MEQAAGHAHGRLVPEPREGHCAHVVQQSLCIYTAAAETARTSHLHMDMHDARRMQHARLGPREHELGLGRHVRRQRRHVLLCRPRPRGSPAPRRARGGTSSAAFRAASGEPGYINYIN